MRRMRNVSQIFQLIKSGITIILSNKVAFYVYMVTVLLMILLLSQMFSQAKQGIQIPVGIVDKDESEFSNFMIKRLSQNPLIKVIKVDETKIKTTITQQDMEAIFIIPKDAQARLLAGEIKGLIQMVYLDENYFALMLSDIVAGDILDEITLRIAEDYYSLGRKKIDSTYEIKENNEVYIQGKTVTYETQENYFVSIHFSNNKRLNIYDPTQDNIMMQKMTLGISFILIAFFTLYIGIHLKEIYHISNQRRLGVAGISVVQMYIAQLVTLIIGTLVMSLPLGLLLFYYERTTIPMIFILLLYAISLSCYVNIVSSLVSKTFLFMVVGLSSIIGMGIVSGSFFSIDVTNPVIFLVAHCFPTFYSMNVYFDKSLFREYSIYTGIYSLVTCCMGIIIVKIKLRRYI